MRIAGVLLLVLALWMMSCSKSTSGAAVLPEVPKLLLEPLDNPLRELVEKRLQELQREPRNPEANGRLGMLLHANLQPTPAKIMYRRAMLLDGRPFRWKYLIALILQKEGKNEEAVRLFREALRLDPGYLSARVGLAETLADAGELDRSSEEYEEVLKRNPSVSNAHYGMGKIELARGNPARAVPHFEKALELAPPYAGAHFALGTALSRTGRPEKAERHFQAHKRLGNRVPGMYDPVKSEMQNLVSSSSVWRRQARTYNLAGLPDEAMEAFQRALAMDPKDRPSKGNLAVLYGKKGDVATANRLLDELLRDDPKDPNVNKLRAATRLEQGDGRAAEEAIRVALEANPGDEVALRILARAVGMQGRRAEAIRHYRAALSIQPNDSPSRLGLGELLLEEGRPDDAIQQLLKIVSVETVETKETARVMYVLAKAYRKAGQPEKARSWLLNALPRAAIRGPRDLFEAIERDLKALATKADDTRAGLGQGKP